MTSTGFAFATRKNTTRKTGTAHRLHASVLATALRMCAIVCLGTAPLWAATDAHATSTEDAAVQKTLKTLVNAIRYSKDDLALKQLDLDGMGQKLMREAWAQMDEAQHKTFKQDLGRVLAGLSFAKGRDIFQYLDAVLYAPVSAAGGEAHCKSTIVIHRDLKKKEMPIEWVLSKQGDSYKVIDTIFLGESTTEGVREEQVLPLIKEGGVPAVMQALAEQAKKSPSKSK